MSVHEGRPIRPSPPITIVLRAVAIFCKKPKALWAGISAALWRRKFAAWTENHTFRYSDALSS
jgi:hypothetical protein